MIFRNYIVVLVMFSVLAGCGSSRVIAPPPGSLDKILAAAPYRVGVGDQLNVQVWRSPELSLAVGVRPDGKVSVPLMGDVVALDKRPVDLAAEIAKGLSSYVRSPQVTVIVQQSNSSAFEYRVRVSGAVNQPTSVPYQRGLTVFDVVQAGGGLSPFAQGNAARLLRVVDGKASEYPLYLKDIFEEGRFDSNYEVLPGDAISVPERMF